MTQLCSGIFKCMAGGAAALLACSCGRPSAVNIELRKQNQSLQYELSQSRSRQASDQQAIQGLRDRVGTLPTLPTTRLAQLFTTQGLLFSRLTGGADLDPNSPGDEGLAIYISPVDASGDRIKMAGTFDIEAFDLDEPQHPLIGHWHFDLEQAKSAWTSVLLEYGYALVCRWQSVVPRHPNLTVKVTFFDELTQTPFTAQRVVGVIVPPRK